MKRTQAHIGRPEYVRADAGDEAVLRAASELLFLGELLVVPTDTLYAVAASALHGEAVSRVFEVKNRPRDQPLPLICSDMAQVRRYLVLDGAAEKLASAFWPGPLTLVLTAHALPAHATAADGTAAVRVPDAAFCRHLAAHADAPLTATSTNLSGEPPARSIDEVPDKIRAAVALIADGGPCTSDAASTIVKVQNGRIRVLREGAVSRNRISTFIGEDLLE